MSGTAYGLVYIESTSIVNGLCSSEIGVCSLGSVRLLVSYVVIGND